MTGNVRHINHKKERWRYYHVFSPGQVLRRVHVAEVDRTLWFNLSDGNFIHIIEPDGLEGGVPIVITRTVSYIYDNMQTGYYVNGNPICHRKRRRERGHSPLLGAKIVRKERKKK